VRRQALTLCTKVIYPHIPTIFGSMSLEKVAIIAPVWALGLARSSPPKGEGPRLCPPQGGRALPPGGEGGSDRGLVRNRWMGTKSSWVVALATLDRSGLLTGVIRLKQGQEGSSKVDVV
jgi:hypothetical protein